MPATSPGRRWIPALLVLTLAAPAAQAAEHFVNINSSTLSFEPAELTIQVGDTVTWTNDGGLHNVAADDDSFTSGPPSTDLWVYSQIFNLGGVVPYHCSEHVDQGMTGTVTVEGIFGDGVESGDDTLWSDSTGLREHCTCYFSSDCAGGSFCDYGPGGFPVEDICTWVDNKPDGVPDAGCDIPHIGPWGGEICDGVCSGSAFGSRLGWEPHELIQLGVQLWADALLLPAEAGGGPPDPDLVEAVLDLDFSSPEVAMNLGRQVNDLLILSGSPGFYEHFCHYEQHPDEPRPGIWVDLSDDACRAASARRLVDALQAELIDAGSGAAFIDQIPEACSDLRRLFSSPCDEKPGVLGCVKQRIEDAAVFISTPR